MFPVYTLDSYAPMRHGAVQPLAETRQFHKPITFDTVYDRKKRANFNGRPIGGLTWLEDGDHYLQVRDGRLYKVHAASGRSVPFVDSDNVAVGLKRLPAMREKDAESLSKRTSLRMDPDRTAILIDYQNDLYYCTLDGQTAARLTSSPAKENYSAFAPDGKFVAFVRERNLYVADVATQTERALTTDGGGMLYNGEADWVYHEELYSRQRRLFWWSPDASSLAFIQVDDTPVHPFTVVNNVPQGQGVEVCPYPRPGELTFLKDGAFLLSSEKTGWKHLYLYDTKGQLQHAVTEGQWEARALHCIDEGNG